MGRRGLLATCEGLDDDPRPVVGAGPEAEAWVWVVATIPAAISATTTATTGPSRRTGPTLGQGRALPALPRSSLTGRPPAVAPCR